MTSSTDASYEVVISCLLSGFFVNLYISPILPKKCLMVLICTEISLLDLIGYNIWNDSVPITNILLLVLLLQNLFV